jgi:DNA-directed RNA polymerase subunit RPC12/RpoP
MVYHGRRVIAPELEDTVYACRRCGAELIRTSVRQMSSAEKGKTAEAA